MSLTKRALVVGAMLLAGCGPGGVNPAQLIDPDVRLHHLAVKNLGISGGTLDLVMAFNNPNGVTLKGVGLTAGLDIEGSHFGDVAMNDPFSLKGKDTTLVTVPLTFRWSGVGNAARAALDYGAVNYGINGKVTIDTPGGVAVDVPFTGQGNVPLLRP